MALPNPSSSAVHDLVNRRHVSTPLSHTRPCNQMADSEHLNSSLMQEEDDSHDTDPNSDQVEKGPTSPLKAQTSHGFSMSATHFPETVLEARGNVPSLAQSEASTGDGSDALNPPYSPRVEVLSMDQIKTLIRKAIDEARALHCTGTSWQEYAGEPSREQLLSTLESVLAGIPDIGDESTHESTQTAEQDDALGALHAEEYHSDKDGANSFHVLGKGLPESEALEDKDTEVTIHNDGGLVAQNENSNNEEEKNNVSRLEQGLTCPSKRQASPGLSVAITHPAQGTDLPLDMLEGGSVDIFAPHSSTHRVAPSIEEGMVDSYAPSSYNHSSSSPPKVAIGHEPRSEALNPLHSPSFRPSPMGKTRNLIERAIEEANALPAVITVYDQFSGVDPKNPLVSALENALASIPDDSTLATEQNAADASCKEGLCGIQRLADILDSRLRPLPTPPPSSPSECGDEKKTDDKTGNIQQASKLEYRLVDEIWDEKEGRYKIIETPSSELDKLDEFLFVVRERTDKYYDEKTTYVDIKSPHIRDSLREICSNIRSVSLSNNKPSIEMKILFHVRTDLHRHRDLTSHHPGNDTAGAHLAVFLDYLNIAFKSTDDSLSHLLSGRKITYDLLWALFGPNVEMYTTCRGTNASRCVLFTQMEQRKDVHGSKYMYIQTRYLGSDGKTLGEVTTNSSIPIFSGETAIELLPVYPFQYHPENDQVRMQLEECGRRYVSLLGIHHMRYKGRAFDYDEKGKVVAVHVEGNIMVDYDCFQEHVPNYPMIQVQRVQSQYSVQGGCDTLEPDHIDPAQLRPEELLICSPTVLGFSLERKRFLEFAVAHISDVEWSKSSSFDDVKIPPEQKKAIYALTKTYFSKRLNAGFHDLVQGKGLGFNFLLYGPPGVGKTLTAETLAETFKAPLYTVAAGQIGVDHVMVEKFLKSIFKIASRWQAILLLDEADVFLAERALNPQTNALVSVFLRELEHYDGIMFLTTNRMQTFDPAILSRIHLPLRYDPLTQEAREAVWRYFLKQATTKAGPAVYTEHIISTMAKQKLNGREIRNVVLIARAMADHDNNVVNTTYLRDSIEARKQMDEDFQGTGAVANMNSYL